MWKKINISGDTFLSKHKSNGNFYKILISDFVNLWYEEIDNECLLRRCKMMNRFVDASDEAFLDHMWSLLDSEEENITRSLCDADTGKTLSLETSLDGLKFGIKFCLTKANNLEFFEEVSQPLLTTIFELEKRQTLLIEIITKKDLEIQEYKLEGATISRKTVETEPFDLQTFSTRCCTDLSSAKSCVSARPSDALTPFVQDLMDKISAVPVVKLDKSDEGYVASPTKPVKLKSPLKNKKLKMYEDSEEDTNKYNKNVVEVKKEEPCNERNLKLKRKPKIQKALTNL